MSLVLCPQSWTKGRQLIWVGSNHQGPKGVSVRRRDILIRVTVSRRLSFQAPQGEVCRKCNDIMNPNTECKLGSDTTTGFRELWTPQETAKGIIGLLISMVSHFSGVACRVPRALKHSIREIIYCSCHIFLYLALLMQRASTTSLSTRQIGITMCHEMSS